MTLMSDDRDVQVEEHHNVGRVDYKFVFNLIRVLVRQFTDSPKEARIDSAATLIQTFGEQYNSSNMYYTCEAFCQW
jgi:hypothetical protein